MNNQLKKAVKELVKESRGSGKAYQEYGKEVAQEYQEKAKKIAKLWIENKDQE